MKKNVTLLAIFLIALFFVACKPNDNQELENIALVEKYQKALKNHDVETMKEVLADNYVGYGPSAGDSTNKADAILNWDYNMQNLFEILEFKRIENIAITNSKGKTKGNWVSSWGKLYVKFRQHGNEATIWSNTIHKIEEGKIVKTIVFHNEADALRQAGYKYTFTDPNRLKAQE